MSPRRVEAALISASLWTLLGRLSCKYSFNQLAIGQIQTVYSYQFSNASPPTVSFVLSNYQGARPNVDKLYENLVVDGAQGHVTLPGLDTAEALSYSQNNGG